MCRLYGFRANEPTKVECTLVHAQNALLLQSEQDRTGRSHADGWGIAFYEDDLPARERRANAAFEDMHFSSTAESVYSKVVVAHVRLATIGEPDVNNAHPFVFGRWTFAHNGTVTGLNTLEPELIAEIDSVFLAHRRGQTDSELLFFWLLTRIRRAGIELNNQPTAEAVAHVVGPCISQIAYRCDHAHAESPARLNIILTNGEIMVATRWNNDLYAVYRDGVRDCEICGIPHIHHEESHDYSAVVIASEPISHEAWAKVPDHSVITISNRMEMNIQPINASRVA